MLAPTRILDPIAKGSGSLLHAQTFSHHPVLCATGLATVRYIGKHGLVNRCAEMGQLFHQKLRTLLELPHVGDVRGRGLLAAVEFVEDKGSRTAMPRKQKFAERFADAALDEGLMVWPNVGQANGTDGDLALLVPAFVISEEEMDEIVSRFSRALLRVVEGRLSGVGNRE